jgi:hypothetical protein
MKEVKVRSKYEKMQNSRQRFHTPTGVSIRKFLIILAVVCRTVCIVFTNPNESRNKNSKHQMRKVGSKNFKNIYALGPTECHAHHNTFCG